MQQRIHVYITRPLISTHILCAMGIIPVQHKAQKKSDRGNGNCSLSDRYKANQQRDMVECLWL